MASGSGLKKVWVKVEDGKPRTATGVRVGNDANIDDVVAEVIRVDGLNISRGLVSVEFDGNKIRTSAVVSDYQTTEDKPLLLSCYVKDEGPSRKRKRVNLQPFYEALKSKEVQDEFLSLDVWLLDNQKLGSRIYVRQAYRDLHELIHTTYQDRNDFLVTGNPGTGKTFFSIYELHSLLQEKIRNGDDEAIVYQSIPLETVMVLTTNTMYEVSPSEVKDLPEIRKTSTWYLVDCGSECVIKPAIRSAKTIVFSLPDERNYKDYYKFTEPKTFYMPVWSLEELLLVRTTTEEEIKRFYGIWGGIPRYVLNSRSVKAIDAAIGKIPNLTAVFGLANEFSASSGDIATSHKIVHIHLKEGADGSPNYEETVINFASDFVMEKVFTAFEATVYSDMRAILDTTRYSTGCEGQLFEFLAHRKLEAGGNFHTRNLRNGSRDQLQLDKLELCTFAQTSELLHYKSRRNVYLKPTPKNFESLDSIIITQQLSPIGCQMTVLKSHPLKKKGLMDIQSKLALGGKPLKVYFVVPPRIFDTYEEQPYHGSKGLLKRHLEQFEQWVLCMKL